MMWPDRTVKGMAALWPGLVGQRCMANLARKTECTMTAAERVKLVDAAMRSRGAEGYLASVQRSFDDAGRQSDAFVAAALQTLLRSGEMETVMFMRAEWLGRISASQPRDASGL